MNDFNDTTYNSLTIFLCIPTYHKCGNLKKNSSLLLIYSVYAHTFLLTCQLQICSNLFRLILAYIRDQIPNTILCLNSPFAPYYSTYGAAPDLSSLSLSSSHTTLHTHRFQIQSIHILPIVLPYATTYLFLQYYFCTISIYIYYTLYTYYMVWIIFNNISL